ncbi:MAG: prepilin-type N-terminal cleavage/methylation domain-containing protein [Acaryochloridaceae cyanobacterium CSU_3_4]|nr:prepilin-type N-terminal cleavage/methylation domain-containing protein [Acaryochloridaceae cyanobacterium CSU_3_4]
MYKRFIRNRLFRPNTTTKGFTLPELLVAAAISLGVVALGGFGLVSILTSSQAANAQNERRTELNRSLDFIATEVRHAESLVKEVATETLPSAFTTSRPADAQPVLILKLPTSSTPIIYYVASPSNNTWLGPKVVYRWGPRFQENGSYQDANTPSSWLHEPLIDRIEDTGVLPTCRPGWTGNGTPGFLACVNNTGSMAELHQNGRIFKNLGTNEIYKANTTVSTRSMHASVSTFTPPNGNTFTVGSGTVTFGADASMTIRVIGGQVSCGSTGPSIPSNATLNFVLPDSTTDRITLNPGSTYTRTVNAGTTLTVTGNLLDNTTDSCGDTTRSYDSAANDWNTSNAKQAITLYNGDAAPSFQPYGGQKSLISFLEDANILEDNVLQLADNQVVMTFELGVEYDANYTTSSAFDMQDVVVEADISPS